jgi:hypothetical protein
MAKNKTEQELRVDLEKKKQADFLKEYSEAIQPIIDKYSMAVIPVVRNMSTEYKVHYEAAFAVQKFTKEEVKVQKGNETLDTQPETDKGTDSDNQTPKE